MIIYSCLFDIFLQLMCFRKLIDTNTQVCSLCWHNFSVLDWHKIWNMRYQTVSDMLLKATKEEEQAFLFLFEVNSSSSICKILGTTPDSYLGSIFKYQMALFSVICCAKWLLYFLCLGRVKITTIWLCWLWKDQYLFSKRNHKYKTKL